LKLRSQLLGALGLLALLSASANAQVLTFEGLGNVEAVANFYNGGTGGNGSGPGPNFGITFGASALALIDSDVPGGSGNFANEPSASTILFFNSGTGAIMNVPAGFTTGFSFFYTSISNVGIVEVFDGLNGTGNLLATVNLPFVPSSGQGDPTGQFDTWTPVGVNFAGTALSVNFGGTANQIGFDNITLGSSTPGGANAAPEPTALALLGLGVLGFTVARRRK
jgi:hypothetical protein